MSIRADASPGEPSDPPGPALVDASTRSLADAWGTENHLDSILDEASQGYGLVTPDAYVEEVIGELADRLQGDGGQGRRVTQALRMKLAAAGVPIQESESWLAMGWRAARDPARRVLSVEELLARPGPRPLVDGILNAGETAMLYGQTGAGKTFVALDLCVAVATGQPFAGCSTRMQRVVYVAAEGVGGLGKRLQALRSQRGPAHNLLIDRDAVNLMSAPEVDHAIKRWWSDRPGLIVLDTLACSMVGGDENLARDIATVIASINRIRTALNATVLVVHHTGKSSAAVERGSSALRSGLDTVMLVKKTGAGVSLAAEKQRNMEPFPPLDLTLVRHDESLVIKVVTGQPSPARASTSNDLREAAEKALMSLSQQGRTPISQTALITVMREQGWKGRTRDLGSALTVAAVDPMSKISVTTGPRNARLYDVQQPPPAVPIPSPSKEGEGEPLERTSSE